jgi:hypothetical protein
MTCLGEMKFDENLHHLEADRKTTPDYRRFFVLRCGKSATNWTFIAAKSGWNHATSRPVNFSAR